MSENDTDIVAVVEHIVNMRQRWNHGKLTLLLSHLFYAIDETIENHNYEHENMQEAEKLLTELIVDLKKIIKNPYELFTRPAKISAKFQENEEEDDCDGDSEPILEVEKKEHFSVSDKEISKTKKSKRKRK